MKYSIYTILLLVCSSAFAGALPNHRHLVTTGYGSVKAKPDMAVVSFAVAAAKTTSLEAKRAVDTRVNRLLRRLQALGVKRSDISASELMTRPEYRETKQHKRVLQDWLARRPLTVTLRKLGRLNTLMNAALKMGVDRVENIHLKVSDEEHYEHAALTRAIKDSKAKAHELAKAYGATLGAIYSIDYENGAPTPPRPILRAASFAKKAGKPGTYVPQKITFKQSIKVVFDLRIAH
jgi:uncharacterized protein YggE